MLVWGADPSDSRPIFVCSDSQRGGPSSGSFRTLVRDCLANRLASHGLYPVFSEDWNRYGHVPENPGLYEPLQVKDASAILLLFPGARSLGVNSWELAMLFDHMAEDLNAGSFYKSILVVPARVCRFLAAASLSNVADASELSNHPVSQIALGAANSFAARWIYMTMKKLYPFCDPYGPAQTLLPWICYDDEQPWEATAEELDKPDSHFSRMIADIEERLATLAMELSIKALSNPSVEAL